MIPSPTSDGGKEHTTARFLPAFKWLSLCHSGKIILFPPQFFLLHLLDSFLCPEDASNLTDAKELARQRERLTEFVKSGNPPWTEKCISPISMLWRKSDGRAALSLDKPGSELEGSERKGDDERVVIVQFDKEGPRRLEVAWKKDILEQERQSKEPKEKI